MAARNEHVPAAWNLKEVNMFVRSMKTFLLLGVIACFVLSTRAFAQSQIFGKISGTITDSTGAVIPGAKITLTNKGTSISYTTTTDNSGYYAVPHLPTGTYEVTAEKEGFERCSNIGVHLDPAESVQLTCSMQVGQVTQTVEVQAEALTVQTEEAKVSRVINDTTIQEMPVNGRNFATLLGLQPGVVQEFTFNSNQNMGLFATQGTHVNGLRGDANNVQIEGSPSTRTRANGAMVAPPSIDAIGEINIVTTGYMPEFSRGAGGQILIELRSGAQEYHGGAWEFVRNDDLDARNFFSNTVSILKLNSFGYNLGGPIIPHKNKLFFFWNQEWDRSRSTGPDTETYPTAVARTGNFSEYCAPGAGTPCPIVPSYLNGVDGLVAGQPFPNNTIPSGLFSTNGSAFVNALPVPNLPGIGTNWVKELPGPSNDRKESIKVDYNMEKIKSHLAVALRHLAQDQHGDWGSIQLENWEILLPSRGATVDFTTNFSPTLLNDFSFTATEDIVHVNLTGGPGLNRSQFGINFPYILGDASKDIPGKIPTINISGFSGLDGLPYPSGSVGKVFVAQDVLTKIKGRHMIKVGGWLEQDGENDRDQVRITPGAASGIGNNMNGTFDFGAASSNPASTGAPLADALLGNYDVYSELGFRNYTPWVSNQYGLFAQDSFRITPHFTLQGGLRWDYFPPYHSRWCNFATFDPLFYSHAPGVQQTIDPTTGFVTGGNPYNGIAVPCTQLPRDAIGHFGAFGMPLTDSTYDAINQRLRDTGMQRGLTPEIFQKHYRNFQPRLGFAWDPLGKGTTSIRGSAGVFYNHFTLSDVTLMGGNTPFQPAIEVVGGSADCPGAPLDSSRHCAGSASTSAGIPLPIPITGQDLVSRIPVVYTWTFSVQHMLPQDTLVEVGYVGTRARHLQLNSDLNQLRQGQLAAGEAACPTACTDSTLIPYLAPYPGLGGLTTALNQASSKYDSLQISAQRRLFKGLQYGLAYTYSNTFDFGSSLYSNSINTYDLKYSFGPADWGRRNILIANYVYQLPFFKQGNALTTRVLGGWELSGVIAFESGTPVTVSPSFGDPAHIGEDFGQYANRLSGCNPNSAPRSVTEWFNTACFADPAVGTFGTGGRNSVWGPGVRNWDFALYKNGKITERFNYQFRAEFFNVLNHPSFNSISTGVGSGNFGQITGAGDPRQIQFGLKVHF
jgi:carboxypeptidase family protein